MTRFSLLIGHADFDWGFQKELFKLYLYNCQCHQIILGCSSNSGYSEMLDNAPADVDLSGRVSLIESIPLDETAESIRATYRITKFPGLFRDSKLTPSVRTAAWKTVAAAAPLQPLPAAKPPTSSPMNYVASLARTSTNTTPASSNARTLSSLSLNDGNDFQVVTSNNKPKEKTVERNKYGQRVDRLDFKNIPREEMGRIKKMKLCNFHFLLGECPNTNCYHDHTHKLTKSERVILEAIARTTPCHYGLDCDDPDCIYGHRCPQSEPGRKNCYWGSSCRFDTAAHGIDTNIVKVTKI